MAGFEDAYKRYTESGQGQAVANMYDQQTQASMNGLKAAYDQNLASQQAAREQIGTTYQNSANNMQAQFERNRRNLNQQAAANGINTGAGSQQQLALQNVWNRDYGALQGQQAQAYANADLAIANLQTEYQNAIQQAQAQGDYRKMAALLDDYNTQYNRQIHQAQTLASYGDFSGYNGIYSSEQITNMRNSWIAQNPLLAYNTGAITADQYKAMTGQDAPGAASAARSTSYGGTTQKKNEKNTPTNLENAPKGNLAPASLSSNAQAIIDAARQTGATLSQAQEAVQRAVASGLVGMNEANQTIQEAAAAGNQGRDYIAGANRAAQNGYYSPTIAATTGLNEAQIAYQRELATQAALERGRAEVARHG